jgi:hypothetical protein
LLGASDDVVLSSALGTDVAEALVLLPLATTQVEIPQSGWNGHQGVASGILSSFCGMICRYGSKEG